jgi:hypothetical protein
MRRMTVKWGKLRIYVPVEFLLFVIVKACIIVHNLNS